MSAKKKKAARPAPKQTPPEPPAKKPDLLLYISLLAAVLLPWFIYAQTLSAGFVWDDHNLIEMQPDKPTAADFGRLWVSDFWQKAESKTGSQYYRPLTTTTFLIDGLIYGKEHPGGFHATNVIIYSITCVLALLLFRTLIGNGVVALVLALLFAANPAHTENVAWVSGRTDLVCAAMMFASLLAYLKADKTGKPGHWVLAVALFVLSLFGKEMSITMVAVVPVHRWLKYGDLKKSALAGLPFLIAAALFWILHAIAAPNISPENVYTTPLPYALNFLRNLALGAWHSLVPGGFDYLVTATREEAQIYFPAPGGLYLAVVLALLAGLVAATLWSLYKKKLLLGLGLAGGMVTLMPVSGIIPIGVVYALRFLLIPSFFFTLALGPLFIWLDAKRFDLGGVKIAAAHIVGVVLIVIYLVASFIQTPNWKDDATLMASVLDDYPKVSLAHFLMGNGLANQGLADEAAKHYRLAIANRPGYSEAEFNLGIMEQRLGRIREAEKLYRSVLKEKPDYMPARYALAKLLAANGREAEAVKLMKQAPPRSR